MANVWREDDRGYPIGRVHPEAIPAVDAAPVRSCHPARGAEDGRSPAGAKGGVRPDGALVVEFERKSGAGCETPVSGVADLPANEDELVQCGIGRGSFEKFEDLNTLARLGHNRLAAHHGSLGARPAISATTTRGERKSDERREGDE
jgi:hypothetical protein